MLSHPCHQPRIQLQVVSALCHLQPTLKEGIQDLFDLFATDFKSESFKLGIVRSFVNTGTIPVDTTNRFVEYKVEQQCAFYQ